jgi:antibiotic biosynthesis monooxygenase (ABM) superfamily enzyme
LPSAGDDANPAGAVMLVQLLLMVYLLLSSFLLLLIMIWLLLPLAPVFTNSWMPEALLLLVLGR